MDEYGFPWFEFIGLLLTGAAMLSAVWYRLHTQITNNREHAANELAKQAQATSVQFQAVHAVISAFQLQVAREYATNQAIKEVESRIVGAIEKLTDRLDTLIDNRKP